MRVKFLESCRVAVDTAQHPLSEGGYMSVAARVGDVMDVPAHHGQSLIESRVAVEADKDTPVTVTPEMATRA